MLPFLALAAFPAVAGNLTLSGPDQKLVAEIAEAEAIFMHGEPSLQFILTEPSSVAMGDLTGAMIGQTLTVSLCNIDLVEAVVRERISGRGLINMPSIEAAIAAAEVLTGETACDTLAPHFPD